MLVNELFIINSLSISMDCFFVIFFFTCNSIHSSKKKREKRRQKNRNKDLFRLVFTTCVCIVCFFCCIAVLMFLCRARNVLKLVN